MSLATPREETIEVLFSADEIAARTKVLAREIAGAGFSDLIVVPILKGSFIFGADLLRALHEAGVALEVDFIFLSSYRDKTHSSGQIEVLSDIKTDVSGRDVLLLDDILESGRTLAFAKDLIAARGAARVATCVLLDKPVARAVEIKADFCGFECPDAFVIGYGMDLAHRFRELPYVGRIV
jgi:hypoxanthine phosphoribosyltransferase